MPLKNCLFFLITCFVSLVVKAADIDVTKYGAVADGKTINTIAIQKAIDECSKQGGGKVIFPAGTWVSGTILLKDDVHLFLHLEAILLGSTDINDYLLVEGFKDGRGSSMGYSFIGAKDAKNIGITGKGKVNGNGRLLLEKNGRSKRPFLVRFVRCTNVTVSDVQLEGPAAWTMHWFECKKIRAERVVIRSRGLSNNDGIDIDCSEDVVVKDCDIDSGDDAICLKTTGPLPCRNIEVYDCKINTNQGAFKLGTESVGNFENINIHHCRVDNTKGIKLYSVDGSHLKNLRISDITIEKTTLPILLRLGARLKTFREGDTKKTVGIIEGVSIKNISVKSATQMAILISGIPAHKVKDVSISNVTVQLPGAGTVEQAKVNLPENEADYPEVTMFGKDMSAYGMYIRHAHNVTVKNIKILLEKADARPAIVGIDLKDVKLDNWNLPATASSEPFIKLETADNITLNAIKPSVKPVTFLQVDGDSKEIVLRADKPNVLLGDGVAKNAVTIKY
jgi:polygalacturonase